MSSVSHQPLVNTKPRPGVPKTVRMKKLTVAKVQIAINATAPVAATVVAATGGTRQPPTSGIRLESCSLVPAYRLAIPPRREPAPSGGGFQPEDVTNPDS